MKTLHYTRREAGMSLIELMVGAAIGLIGIVIITHIYLTNEQHKRATTAAGGAQTNGAIAMYALEREIRQAGFGLNSSYAFTCNCDQITNDGCSALQYHYDAKYSFPPNASLTNARNSIALYPFIITDRAAGPDTLSVFYGSDNQRVLSTQLIESMANPGSDIKPDGSAGFDAGDFIVLQQVKPGPPVTYPCALYRVTNVIAETLVHAEDPLYPWNPAAGGLLPRFDKDVTRIFNLGPRPNWKTFGIKYDATNTINYGKLQMTDQFKVLTVPGWQTQDLMDGIVDLQAQYGKDLNGNGVIESAEWTKVLSRNGPLTNFDATDIMQVIAVRFAVLARDDHYHKPSTAGGPCEATTAANRPTWAGGAFLTFDAPGALPSCYKYRVFETVVPLRNMIWRPE
jgi:type IV pilus assembly protein PilW